MCTGAPGTLSVFKTAAISAFRVYSESWFTLCFTLRARGGQRDVRANQNITQGTKNVPSGGKKKPEGGGTPPFLTGIFRFAGVVQQQARPVAQTGRSQSAGGF